MFQALSVVGLLVALCAAGSSDAGAPLGLCVAVLAVGLGMFATFGALGGLFN